MTLRSSDLQSDSDLDSIRNSCDVFFSKLCVKRTTCPILPAYDWRQERCNHKVSPGPLSSGLYPQPNHKSESTTITMKLIYFLVLLQSSFCLKTNMFLIKSLKISTYMWIHFAYLHSIFIQCHRDGVFEQQTDTHTKSSHFFLCICF